MSQFKLVSVHTLGRTALWHNVWSEYHHAATSGRSEDYFVRVFWHFMRVSRSISAQPRVVGRGWRPVWGAASPLREGESFLLSCHLLYYQDWVLCFMTYYYARSDELRASRAASSGLHNFLWAYNACLGDLAVS